MKIADALHRFEIFAHFDAGEREKFAHFLTRRHLRARTTVVKHGDTSRDGYLIESGEVRISRETAYGAFDLAVLHTGQLFGEVTLLDGQARTGDVITRTDSDLLVLDTAALEAATVDDPGLAVAFHWSLWKSLSAKLRATNQRLTEFFPDQGRDPATTATATDDDTEGFRLDMESKRRLFSEQRLSTGEIHFLASLSREEKLTPGQVIFREGDAGDEMFVVLDGRVMISKFIPGAGDEALAFLERGDYFGEMALIDREPRSASAAAHDAGAVVLAIPREVLNSILNIEKASSLRLLKLLCSLIANRLRELDEKILGWFILAQASSDQR